MYSAASSLIRRRCVVQLLEPLRCFSTQTITLTGGYDSSSIKEERIPKQVVLLQDQEGILFSIPNKNPTVISSIDPTHLPLPSTDGKGRNFVVHDSFLIGRRRSRHCFYPWRSFSTQAQGQTQTLARDDADSSEERARRRRVPMLLVFSRYQSPQSCSGLLSLSRSIENGKDRNFLKFEQEISLPDTAAAGKSICIGSSEGILFTIPKEMSAVDPLTGAHLPLPSTLPLQIDSNSLLLKTILSPSRDMVILSDHYARLGDEGDRYWMELLSDFGYICDIIFHKGLLYALGHEGLVGIYDLNNPSWPTLTLWRE